MPFGPHFAALDLLERKDPEGIDRAMAGHFRSHLNEIEERTVAASRARGRILRTAFRAHRAGAFELCAPVFLLRADGMSQELEKESYFCAARSIEKAEKLRDRMDDLFFGAVLNTLTKPQAIREPKGVRKGKPRAAGFLNSHAVVHGESVDYATELNSLKAISVLNFMSVALVYKKENVPEHANPGTSALGAGLRR